VKRAIADHTALRAVIRGILREAPYQSSQRVVLQPVRFNGPSIRPFLTAAGAAGLMGLYSWMQGAFACSDGYSNYPLVDTPTIYEDALSAQAWQGDIATRYNAQFDPNAITDGAPTSDLSRALGIYTAVDTAAKTWPAGTGEWAGMTQSQGSVKAQTLAVLSMYSNCAVSILDPLIFKESGPPQELKTRDSYIKMLKDIVENVHRTWTDGMAEQGGTLSTRFQSESAVVKKAFSDATKVEQSSYTNVIAAIK
jgi:hypothetical protein